MKSRPHWTRRQFLRGLGVSLTLPWMESLAGPVWAQESDAETSPTPARLLYVYLPNGVHVPAWLPAPRQPQAAPREGRHGALPMELPPSLAALDPWREEISLLTGLTCNQARAHGDGPGDHARAAAAFLTGSHPLKANGAVRLGVSADQLAAQAIGKRTRFRSLQLGCESSGNAGQCDSGYACAYSDNISWQDATTPCSKEVHPQRLFDRLFRGEAESAVDQLTRLRRRQSILDVVREDAKDLGRRLSRRDLDKLEEYLNGLRELERRMTVASEGVAAEVPDERRPDGLPSGFRDHVRLLIDMLVLAFQTDTTRVATLMFGNEGSARRYLEAGVRGGHHGVTHHKGDERLIAEVCAINRFHLGEFLYLLEALRGAEDGAEGHLLGRTAVVLGSGIADGNRHDHHAVPLLLAGGQELGLVGGAWREYPVETPLTNLHLDLLARLGVEAERLGDSQGRLVGLDRAPV